MSRCGCRLLELVHLPGATVAANQRPAFAPFVPQVPPCPLCARAEVDAASLPVDLPVLPGSVMPSSGSAYQQGGLEHVSSGPVWLAGRYGVNKMLSR